ncbi:Rz1-like lysis system protein LysC [Xanthomonas oryzae]|uniref:Rz1-like lysis system protein LysC n=1 Tax=Xanthomonas oryzae TaxID=347 RepID=UPI003CCE6B87
MLLPSCSTLLGPPEQYLRPCEVSYLPKGRAATQADLVRLAVDREFDVRKCNADKSAIKAFYEGYCKAKGCKVKYGSDAK